MAIDKENQIELTASATDMQRLIAELYPVCRSITGEGLRQTLRVLGQLIPLQVTEVASGTQVFDWTVPKEWNIRDAYIKTSRGERVVDFAAQNLHVMSYSVPVHTRMSLVDLKSRLFSLPDHPDWIPYRTSYYKEDWAFCLTHKQLLALQDDTYEICIDSSLEQGSLTLGESYLPGSKSEEVLISTHICHPSLVNDNLSGLAVAAFLARYLSGTPRRYSYRFLFIPGTIGAVTWLALNEPVLPRIRHGLVITGVGDAGHTTYKKSRRGDADIDRAVMHVLRHSGAPYEIQDFTPYGYDERQYCSPAFNLPVGCMMRTPFGRYPQYHTSADDLELVQPESLFDSLSKCAQVVDVLEHDQRFLNLNPKAEPQLGKRGLYETIGGQSDTKIFQLALLWVLNLSDGESSLLDIATRADLPFDVIRRAAMKLLTAGLLEELQS